jgi:hypothetical protein
MSNLKPLRIGITIGLQTTDESLWINGIKQNAIFLAKLMMRSPFRHDVLLLNTTGVELSDALPWDLVEFPTYQFDDACDGLDIVIELGGQVSAAQTKRIKANGTCLISYCCGPEYIQNIEAMIFGRRLWDDIFINQDYDELWIIPQVWQLNRGFLQTFRRCPMRKVPFVWDPMALDALSVDMPNTGLYHPSGEPKRLTIIEPNIDVLKFCLYPILIAEKVFRTNADSIAYLHVANGKNLVDSEHEFSGLMRKLDIVNANKASFIGRVRTPDFLSDHTDIVISHQWGLPLNYFYLECCWQGYPLIHNAELISDLGYYYPDHDIELGAKQVLKAMHSHDESYMEYRDHQRGMISRYLATNDDLIAEYDDLLFGVLSQKAGMVSF